MAGPFTCMIYTQTGEGSLCSTMTWDERSKCTVLATDIPVSFCWTAGFHTSPFSLPFPDDSPMCDLGTYLFPRWSTGIFEDKGYSFPIYFFPCLHLTPLSHSTTQPSYLHTAGILNGYKLNNAFSSHDTNSVLEKAWFKEWFPRNLKGP